MSFPLVSIVIPSYKPEFFEQALRSAIGQTYPNIEIVVSDNCPTEAIKTICAKFNNINYSRNPEKGAGNVIKALYAGTGDYIKPLFDDDLLHPFCIEKMVRAIQSNDSIQLVFSASSIIDNHNNKISIRKPNNGSALISGRDIQRQMALSFINIIGEFSSVLYSRNAIEHFAPSALFTLGEHDYSFGLADIAAFINMSRDKNMYYYDEELTYFRHDALLQSNSNPAANKNFVHCVTEWVDLLLNAYDTNVISLDELNNSQNLVINFLDTWKTTYPIVEQFKLNYQQKIQQALTNVT
jgi:glycosyltransferase involved in cell wall biosynthesis